MIADEILTHAGFLKNNLKTFIGYISKGIQLLADTVFDSANDNSHQLLVIPPEFYTTYYKEVRSKTFTDAYDDDSKGQGMQPFLFAGTIRLENHKLELINLQCISKDYSNWWNYLTAAEIEACENLVNTYPIDLTTYSDYPDEKDVLHYAGYVTYSFKPENHDTTDLGYQYTDFNGGHSVNNIEVQFINGDFSQVGDYVDFSFTLYDFSMHQCCALYKQPFMMVTSDLSAVTDYITANDAVNNYHETVTTGDGDGFTIYYGDNYIIYYIPSGNKVSYSDIQLNTQNVINTILTDNPNLTPFTFPTYEDNKHGGQEDETDSNHTKPMILNKVVPDTNGMVYYYELDKDDVWKVRSGLNTINLDPLVLKDVTRNLVSYKIFAFAPSTLIKTKTPVIVHIGGREIKYNDASIPANYVEELNTINLGSITIGKLFGDYRDFAPYTKIELFVPFCGWTTLPSWCIDSTITGEMFVDMWNGSCKAVIKASAPESDGVVVCEMGGVCAYDVPFVADATGAKAASLLSKVATTAGAVATGNPLAIATSGISLATALNENYTRMIGVVGDGSNINGLDHMFIKLTRVSWTDPHKKARPDAYKRMHGIPCGKQLKLSEGDGFTQINDANITGAMTDREKQMIIDGFRHGLIL